MFILSPELSESEFKKGPDKVGVRISQCGGNLFLAAIHRMVSSYDVDEALERKQPASNYLERQSAG